MGTTFCGQDGHLRLGASIPRTDHLCLGISVTCASDHVILFLGSYEAKLGHRDKNPCEKWRKESKGSINCCVVVSMGWHMDVAVPCTMRTGSRTFHNNTWSIDNFDLLMSFSDFPYPTSQSSRLWCLGSCSGMLTCFSAEKRTRAEWCCFLAPLPFSAQELWGSKMCVKDILNFCLSHHAGLDIDGLLDQSSSHKWFGYMLSTANARKRQHDIDHRLQSAASTFHVNKRILCNKMVSTASWQFFLMFWLHRWLVLLVGIAKFPQMISENSTRIAGNCFDVLWACHLTWLGTNHGIQYFLHGTAGLINNLNTMDSRYGRPNLFFFPGPFSPQTIR